MKAFIYMVLAVLVIGVCFAGCSGDNDQTVDAMNAEALKLAQIGQKDQALKKATAALAKSEKENGPDHPNTAMSLEILGLVYQSMGDANNAESSFLRALSIVKKAYGPNTGQAAKIMNNLAGIYYAQNQYVLASSFFKQSQAILQKILPSDDSRLTLLQKNIDVCEGLQNGEKLQSTQLPGSSGNAGPEALADGPMKAPMVNMVQDLVPQQVKDAMISQLNQQNIIISDLEAIAPVLIDNKGMVFPYHALKKRKDADAAQEIVVLFAAIKNPKDPNAMIFQQCRIISHSSYLSALEKGGVPQLKQELLDVFPGLYL
jgi:tetratricopeptide (TPR) repeat protein